MKKIFICLILAVLSVSCGRRADIVVIVSANAEWKAFSKIVKPGNSIYHGSPYGKWFSRDIDGNNVIFFHGGWGKIDAAGSAQYAIGTFRPRLIINLGTAGGFPGKVEKEAVIFASKAITYDIYEKMGDSEEAIGYYSTPLSLPRLRMNDIKISPIVSADQDLAPERFDMLYSKYGAFAGDWESSAIAHVAKKNNVKCYIIRGITDIVYPSGSNTYGNYAEFEKETDVVMNKLVKYLMMILQDESAAPRA